MELVRVYGWERFPWLRHGFTTRTGGGTSAYGAEGELNLGLTREGDPATVRASRAQVAAAIGCERLRTVRQVHGKRVVRAGEPPEEADGMVTDEAGKALGIMTADCVPVLLVDTRLRAVAAIHAGWRGTAAGIAEAGVAAMAREFGSRAGDVLAAVGPSIGPCCYAVGDELRSQFADDLFDGEKFDLWETNRRQLVAAGVREVTVVGECTACCRVDGRRKYFSHRAENGVTGRSMGLIAVVQAPPV